MRTPHVRNPEGIQCRAVPRIRSLKTARGVHAAGSSAGVLCQNEHPRVRNTCVQTTGATHVGECPAQTAPQGCSKSSSFAGRAGFGLQNRREDAARFTRRRPRTAYSRKQPLGIRRRPARRRTTRVLAGESGSRRHPITNSCRLRSLRSLRPTWLAIASHVCNFERYMPSPRRAWRNNAELIVEWTRSWCDEA